MGSSLQTATVEKRYAGTVAGHLKAAADMPMHDLIDTILSYNPAIEAGTTYSEEGYEPNIYTDDALLASKVRNVYVSVLRARFGFSISDTYSPDF